MYKPNVVAPVCKQQEHGAHSHRQIFGGIFIPNSLFGGAYFGQHISAEYLFSIYPQRLNVAHSVEDKHACICTLQQCHITRGVQRSKSWLLWSSLCGTDNERGDLPGTVLRIICTAWMSSSTEGAKSDLLINTETTSNTFSIWCLSLPSMMTR